MSGVYIKAAMRLSDRLLKHRTASSRECTGRQSQSLYEAVQMQILLAPSSFGESAFQTK